MYLLKKNPHVLLAGAGIAFATTMSTASFDPGHSGCTTLNCLTRYFCAIDQCNQHFIPGDPPDSEIAWALDICKKGAEDFLIACDNGTPAGQLALLWEQFLGDLALCYGQYGTGAEDADFLDLLNCYNAVLARFRNFIDGLPCGEDALPSSSSGRISLMPMQALELSAFEAGSLDGKYPVTANSTLGFTAGVNVSAGTSYDVRQVPCIKRAVLVAIYQTKGGAEVSVEDVDMDTSDGVHFDFHVIGSKVVDATDITLISIFFDEDNTPHLGEVGTLEIQDSPITGDWNRDEVLNTQDVIDFLASYDAQTKRADINGDTQVTPQDAVEFVNPTP